MKSLPILSPSQATAFDCLRAGSFKYVKKIIAPQGDAAAAGSAIHKLVEIYYKTGSMPAGSDIAPMAVAALAYIPRFSEAPRSEHRIIGLKCAGATFGRDGDDEFGVKVDIYVPDRRVGGLRIGPEERPWESHDAKGRPIPLVIDLKTTGNKQFRYMKHSEDLRGDRVGGKCDAQVLVYGKCALDDFTEKYGEEPEHIQFRWTYILRDNTRPRVRVTDFTMTPDEIRRAETLWTPDIEVIQFIRSMEIEPEELPPNLAMCKAFGGCHYSWRGIDACQLTPAQEMEANMTTPNTAPTESLASKLAAFQKGVAQAVASQAPPVVAATPTTAPSLPPGNFGATPAVHVAPSPAAMPVAPVAAPAPAPATIGGLSAAATEVMQRIAPELEQLQPKQYVELIDYCVAHGQITDAAVIAELKAFLSPPAETAAPAPTAEATETEKRGRGRPKGSGNKKNSTAPASSDDAAALAAIVNEETGSTGGSSFQDRLSRALAAGLRAAADALEDG